MPPPPVTPSPHRFVVKREAPVRLPLARAAQQQTPHPGTQQFNSTPRFNFSSTPRPTATQTLPGPTPSTARYSTPARKTSRQQDTIQSSPDGLSRNVHDSIETDERHEDLKYESVDEEDGYRIQQPSPKRRRLSSSPMLLDGDDHGLRTDLPPIALEEDDFFSSSIPILPSPPGAAAPRTTFAASRFLISTPAPPDASQSHNPSQATFLKPPRFRPPDSTDQAQIQTDPLPEQFSPHRRGQKYLVGGLAAEVRDWLVSIESSLPAESYPKIKDDPWLVKMIIDEVKGGIRAGMTLVRGRRIISDERIGMGTINHLGLVKVILAGEGAGTGLQKGNNAEVGRMVGIKGPLWEVVIEGEKWGVGVDWKVLT